MQQSKLKELYKQVYDQVYPQIKGQKVGVLSTVIYLILDSDKTQAEQICQELEIKGNSSWKEDLSIGLDVIGNKLIMSPDTQNNIDYYYIILIALAIVGVPAALVFIAAKIRAAKKPTANPVGKPPAAPPPKKSEYASLCLVVPASVAGKFTNKNPIDKADLEDLIDNASYFLCTNDQKADSVQEKLDLTEEKITDISEQREVYMRINIADGQDMIGKQISYALKSNLPAHGQGVIRKIACIKYLSVSGLEGFNRI